MKRPSLPDSKLGRRLLLACGVLMLLLLVTGLSGILTTRHINQRLDDVVNRSVPAMQSQQQLAEESRRMGYLAQSLLNAGDLADVARQQQQVERALQDMQQASRHLQQLYPRRSQALSARIEQSRRSAEQLATLIQQRLATRQQLAMQHTSLEWLLDDLRAELDFLLDEKLLGLNQRLRSGQAAQQSRLLASDIALLTRLEQQTDQLGAQLANLAGNSGQHNWPQKLLAINQLGTTLATQATTLHSSQKGSLQALLQRLQLQTRIDSPLARQFGRLQQQQQQVSQSMQALHAALSRQHSLASELGQEAGRQSRQDLADAGSAGLHGNWLLIATTSVALLLMCWLLFGLLGRRVLTPLVWLGQNIAAISRGHYQLPHQVRGTDEIGQLGERLAALAVQMAEIERTQALTLLEHTTAALLACQADGLIRSVNRSAQALLPDSVVGSKLQHTLPPDICVAVLALQENDTLDISLPFGSHEDEQTLRLSACCIGQQHARLILLTLQDISAQTRSARWLSRKVSEKTAALDAANLALRGEIAARQQSQASLLQATKLAAVGQTTTSLAHELNQPLGALGNYLFSARLQLSRQDWAGLDDTLQQAGQVGDRLARLVRSYRQLARPLAPSPQLQKLDMVTLVQDVLTLLGSRLQKAGIEVLLALPEKLPVYGEMVRLEQIVLNLLGNALDAMPASGGKLRLELQRDRGRAELWVMDNGQGLDAETASHLFQPFYTTKADGLGLGLNICQTLAEECDAGIRAANLLPHGALFILSLKVDDAD